MELHLWCSWEVNCTEVRVRSKCTVSVVTSDVESALQGSFFSTAEQVSSSTIDVDRLWLHPCRLTLVCMHVE